MAAPKWAAPARRELRAARRRLDRMIDDERALGWASPEDGGWFELLRTADLALLSGLAQPCDANWTCVGEAAAMLRDAMERLGIAVFDPRVPVDPAGPELDPRTNFDVLRSADMLLVRALGERSWDGPAYAAPVLRLGLKLFGVPRANAARMGVPLLELGADEVAGHA